MNRLLTVLILLVATGLAATVISLRSCARAGREDGFVFSADPARVRQINLRAGAERFSLARAGGNWEVREGDFEDLADSAQAEAVLALATRLVAYDRIPEVRDRDQLGEFGLRSSKRWIELEGDRKIRLLLGKEAAAEGRIYARIDGENDVYLIDDAIVRFTEKPLREFRDRRLTRVLPSQVDRFSISGQSGEIEIARKPSGWEILKPLSAPADAVEVEKFLARLLSLDVLGFVGPDSGNIGLYGLADGRNQAALYVEGRERPMVLRFGSPDAEHPGEVFAQFTPRDTVVRLPEAARAALDARPDTFRDRRIFPVNPDIVDLIRISSDGREVSLRRDGEKWALTESGGAARAASEAAVARLFDVLATPSVLEFSAAPPPADPPSRSVGFYSVLTENSAEENAGEHPVAKVIFYPPAGGRSLCVVEGQSGGLLVPEALAAGISADPAKWVAP